MDRPATLAALDGIIERGGAIALFHDDHLKCRENRWVEALEEVRRRFEDRDDFTKLRKSGNVEPHETVLLASAFARLESLGVTERRSLSVDGVVARALSFSASSPEKLGEPTAGIRSRGAGGRFALCRGWRLDRARRVRCSDRSQALT